MLIFDWQITCNINKIWGYRGGGGVGGGKKKERKKENELLEGYRVPEGPSLCFAECYISVIQEIICHYFSNIAPP